jgi:hypothetical protein
MNLAVHPSYSQIYKRANKLDIPNKRLNEEQDDIIMAIYSTGGIKVTITGQRRQEK